MSAKFWQEKRSNPVKGNLEGGEAPYLEVHHRRWFTGEAIFLNLVAVGSRAELGHIAGPLSPEVQAEFQQLEKLIEAAPDLLKAAKAIVMQTPGITATESELLRELQAAVKKAEGVQP
jgi:hypothetical protein